MKVYKQTKNNDEIIIETDRPIVIKIGKRKYFISEKHGELVINKSMKSIQIFPHVGNEIGIK